MAEVLGRVDGYCGGRSGSLHISAKELGVVLTSTIVGGELSMAPGVALAQKMGAGQGDHGPGAITAVFFGDGAACEGIFHEALNLAVHWQLPLLFVCENNQWQAFVHRLETMADTAIAVLGARPRRRDAARRRQRCRGGAGRCRAGGGEDPRHRSAAVPGAAHLPVARPFRARRSGLCRCRGARALAGARSDRDVARTAC
jgi:hypothetical protein